MRKIHTKYAVKLVSVFSKQLLSAFDIALKVDKSADSRPTIGTFIDYR